MKKIAAFFTAVMMAALSMAAPANALEPDTATAAMAAISQQALVAAHTGSCTADGDFFMHLY